MVSRKKSSAEKKDPYVVMTVVVRESERDEMLERASAEGLKLDEWCKATLVLGARR